MQNHTHKQAEFILFFLKGELGDFKADICLF